MSSAPRRAARLPRLQRPILGACEKLLPAGSYEGYNDLRLSSSSSGEETQSDDLSKADSKNASVRHAFKVIENFYTSRLFGPPAGQELPPLVSANQNLYSAEPAAQNFADIRSRLDEILSNAKDDLALIDKEYRFKAGQQNVKLTDILTIPMQRILKYHLLLKQLFDNTPPDHEESRALDKAFEVMKDVSDYVNEGKRDHEVMGVIREIQSKIPNSVRDEQCVYYGRLLQDGPVKVTDSAYGQKPKSRYAFLFERVLLICKNKDEELRNAYPVSKFKIVDPEQESQVNRASNTLTRRFTTTLFDHTSLMVLIKDSCVDAGDPQPYLQFIFRSPQIRDKWRTMIEKAIDRNSPETAKRLKHRVIYTSYPNPTECGVCHKFLLGLFYQGYHCQICKKDMHYACLDLGSMVCRPPTLNSLIHRSNSSGTTHVLMQPQRFEIGERLQALQSVSSPDAAVLSFQKGEFIEVLHDNDDGSITGRLVNSPARVGILTRESVKRVSRSHSLVGGSPTPPLHQQQSPMRTIDPTLNRLSASAMADSADKRPSLVSSEIITTCEAYVGLPIEEYPWYHGKLERSEARTYLENNPNGTFLVRQSSNQSQFVLSVVYEGADKHMKIELERDSRLYYLHGARYFHDIPSLIKYYRNQSLNEGFDNLNTCLRGTPLRCTSFRAVHSFAGHASDSIRYLKLERGDPVRVLNTNGEENGWWKGISRGVTGYFPLAYVKEDSGPESDADPSEQTPQSTEVY